MDILGAAHIAAAAADTHIALAEAGIVVVELVHGLEAHTIPCLGADIVAACHGAVIIQHTGGPHAAALAVTAGLVVDNVGGVEAAAGNAHGIAAAAADAVVIEFTPHLQRVDVLHHGAIRDGGNIDLALVLGDKGGGKITSCLTAEQVGKGLVLHLDEYAVIVDTHRHGIVVGSIAAHRHAEAGFKTLAALHQEELHLLTEALIEVVSLAAVFHKDGVEAVDTVDIAGAEEQHHGARIHFTLPHIVLGEVQQRLDDGVKDLFGGEVGLLIKDDLLHALHLAVADELAHFLGGIDAVGLAQGGQHLIHALFRHYITHIRTSLTRPAAPAPSAGSRDSAWQDRDRNRWRHICPYPP